MASEVASRTLEFVLAQCTRDLNIIIIADQLPRRSRLILNRSIGWKLVRNTIFGLLLILESWGTIVASEAWTKRTAEHNSVLLALIELREMIGYALTSMNSQFRFHRLFLIRLIPRKM